ncbi:protein of unknown function [Nitrospira japonica]|uniref:Uncharacterized protein n=1 Tax=Nitrospira japonica TaxID=1325564 RepID=A0A1W1I0J3_9BACT|nr:hypothetical protein [Nitrospira japonica]SLM46497.1 protein of unknown function [Nitrospira japonica]
MGYSDDELKKLERALTEAFHVPINRPASQGEMARRVMRTLRRPADIPVSGLLDQFVWRVATIAAAVVLVVSMLTVHVSRTSTGESTLLLAEEFETTPLFGD